MALFGRVDLVDLQFREAELPEVPHAPVRLPVAAWFVFARTLWLAGRRSGCEGLTDFRARVRHAAYQLAVQSDTHPRIAVIGHGVFNRYLASELRDAGFSGLATPKIGHADFTVYTR